ncbi:MAG TPA: type II secretion system minor pseudopilin GspK [Halioglobus sp.]
MRCRHCSRPPDHCAARQRGAALIVAMLVFALAAALVVAMKSEFTRFYQRNANILMDEQAQAFLRGAEDLAGIVLQADYDQDKTKGVARDDLQEDWNKSGTFPLENIGWMRGVVEDLQGRFNLNALASKVPPAVPPGSGATGTPARFTAAQEQFIRLLQALGEPQVSEQQAIQITESVSDWLDADANPNMDGAEDDYYSAQDPPYRTANRPMASVSEIRAVANMTPAIYQALLGCACVTVWPQVPGKLNIHTAPAMVLRSINADRDLSPLSEAEGESLEEERADKGFENINTFIANAVFQGKQERMKDIQKLLGQDSSYFLVQAEVEVAGRNTRLYSVLERHNRKISAIVRASGSL